MFVMLNYEEDIRIFISSLNFLLCESKNREHFELNDQSNKRSKAASDKLNYRYSLRFFHLASDWFFPHNTITFQK